MYQLGCSLKCSFVNRGCNQSSFLRVTPNLTDRDITPAVSDRHMLICSDRAAYSSASLKAQGLAVFHTDSPPFLHLPCVQAYSPQTWSVSVDKSGRSWCVWTLTQAIRFVLFCFLTWTVCCPCTSSFRRSRSRAPQPAGEAPVCSGLKQLPVRGAVLGTLPFFSPPAYATGPLPGGIFSGTLPHPKCFAEHISYEKNWFIARFSPCLVGWVWMPFRAHLLSTPVGTMLYISCCVVVRAVCCAWKHLW